MSQTLQTLGKTKSPQFKVKKKITKEKPVFEYQSKWEDAEFCGSQQPAL